MFPIVVVADWLHPRFARHKVLVMLYAYFDESGTDGQSPVTAIAGFVGTKWQVIEERWLEVLSEFADKGVRTFHMTDCAAQEGEFARVDTPQRNYIIARLSDVLGVLPLQAVFSAVVRGDWKDVVSDEAFLARFPKPFDLCFDDVVRQLWEWAAKNTNGEKVAPMFAHQAEYHERMAAVGRAYEVDGWYRQLLGAIEFGRPQEIVPLQCADLVVHQVGWNIEKRRYGKISIANSGQTLALENATGGRFIHGQWFDAEGLTRTVENFRKTGEIYPLEPLS